MTQKPPILVLRHEVCSSLGLLERLLEEQEITVQYLNTSQGEVLAKPLSDYSHLIILGGAISAYQSEQYPFLKYEFKLVEKAIAQQIPTIGICLGSQVLAHVLGGTVYRGESGREAGWCVLEKTEAASIDPIFKDFPQQFKVFESHQDTFTIPPECVHLVLSHTYPNQAFRYRDYVWALQFHPEIDDQVLIDCADVIRQELIDSQIEDTTIEQLIAEASYYAPFTAPLADTIMRNFLQVKSKALAPL
ncbi:MAG: type 1 glutamine amidotransferase [Leptolyngbyaceae cyanobacterium SL_7_1]|nr:type 1 glutamine amidotransferase [Leptolyngbyaceae cyanobacterium SL_7_1]